MVNCPVRTMCTNNIGQGDGMRDKEGAREKVGGRHPKMTHRMKRAFCVNEAFPFVHLLPHSLHGE